MKKKYAIAMSLLLSGSLFRPGFGSDFGSPVIGSYRIRMSLENEKPYLGADTRKMPTLVSLNLDTRPDKDDFFDRNRRNIYSSVWAFASLNYLYCDLVGFMDKDLHSAYHTGEVDGTRITPQFLAGAAVMMQVSLANVFLPQIIKNERTLRWVQFASGAFMTLVQSATLFVDEPTPYYATFSAFEIGATTFIALDALRWKPKPVKKLPR